MEETADYDINVDGRSYTLTGPKGMSEQQVWSAFTEDRVNSVDYSSDSSTIREQIKSLPKDLKQQALRRWADTVVDKETEEGGVGRRIDNVFRTLARGTLIGSGIDELTAATNSGAHMITGGLLGAPYDETLAYQRARDRRLDKDNPVLSTVGQLAGGMVSAAPVISQGRNWLERTLLGGLYGTGHANIANFGNNEGGEGSTAEQFDRRTDGSATATAIGGTVGLVAPSAAGAVQGLVRRGADAVSSAYPSLRQAATAIPGVKPPDADDIADRVLLNKMDSQGTTPQQAVRELQGARRDSQVGASGAPAGLPHTLADTSKDMGRLTSSIYRQGGEAANDVTARLETRQRGPSEMFNKRWDNPEFDPTQTVKAQGRPKTLTRDQLPADQRGQWSNIRDGFSRVLGISSSKSARQQEGEIIDEMKALAKPKYQEAYDESQSFDLQPILDGMALQVMQFPKQFAAKLQRSLDMFTDQSPNKFPINNVERFDAAKKALDDEIDRIGPRTNMGRMLTDFKNQMLRVVDNVNPKYAEARGIWVEGMANKEAIDLGRNALKEDSFVSVEAYRELNKAQRKLFRVGLLEAYDAATKGVKSGTDITNIFDKRGVRELLSEVLNSSGDNLSKRAAERFSSFLGRMRDQQRTRKGLYGSPTAERIMDDTQLAANTFSQLWQQFRNRPDLVNQTLQGIGMLVHRTFGHRQDVALALSRRLLETNPDEQAKILIRLHRLASQRGQGVEFMQGMDQIMRRAASTSVRIGQGQNNE